MTKPTTRKYGRTLATALCLTGLAGVSHSALAASANGINAIDGQRAARAKELPRTAKADSGVVGKLNGKVMSAPAIDLTLADGTKIQARLQRVARDDNKAVQSWVGTFEDSPGSSLVISKAKGVLTGYVNYKDQVLQLLPAAGGNHVLFAVDPARLPLQTDEVVQSNLGGDDALATTSDYGTGGTTTATSGTAVVHDVLIFYTAASASRYGQAAVESLIQSAVQSTNQGYLNSRANVTLNVVGLQQTAVTESSGMGAALTALKNNTTVRSLRDKLAADMVIMISENTGSCGTSSLTIMTLNGVTNVDAYAVSNSDCLSQYTFAHELGHLQRLDHNRENSVNIGMYAYSYGFRHCVSGGFRDIMSYPCSSVPRVLYFANPSVDYNGYPTGVSYESDPANSAEGARTLNNTAATVAAYRVSSSSTTPTPTPTPTAPTSPSNLVAQSVAYNAVALRWSDTSSNESGFKVQRSTDGVNFAEIATLGAGSVAFSDAAVGASTNYYYRVSAYNSVGGSGYSNTLAVTTPAAPVAEPTPTPPPPTATPALPAAPSNVAAANNADGSAVVSWSDVSTSEQNFEVRRETWNSKRSRWTSMQSVGIVSANLTSMVDMTGNGTYRYTVRAVNTSGGSNYAGPAQVTVTGGSGGSSNGKGKNH